MRQISFARTLISLTFVAAGQLVAAEGSASLTDSGPEVVRRVVQTLVAVAVLVVMARPGHDESDARGASPELDGSLASRSRSLASRSMRSGLTKVEPASGSAG